MSAKCIQTGMLMLQGQRKKKKKKKVQPSQRPGRPDGQLQIQGSDPRPFLLGVSVCAAWPEAGIDAIHHECK